jgi:hypothetical protein
MSSITLVWSIILCKNRDIGITSFVPPLVALKNGAKQKARELSCIRHVETGTLYNLKTRTTMDKMEKDEIAKDWMERMEKRHADHKERWYGDPLPWKAWGSWFSWGSPVGMGIGWTLFIVPLGFFLWVLHLVGKF